MDTVVYLREPVAGDGERQAAECHFAVVTQRGDVPDNVLVIPRFSLLPYAAEVHYDLEKRGCRFANTLQQHRWIASFDWYDDLREHTPETWTEDELPYTEYGGPFVVKGATNSLKFRWQTHMYAATKREAVEVGFRLRQDSLIGEQPLKYRRYVPLRLHEEAVVGPPFAHEFRFFFWGTGCLGAAYYWSCAENVDLPVPPEALAKAQECAGIAAKRCRFFVLDVAQTESGDWILIEVNDGQQSGLSEIEPGAFYGRLAEVAATV